MAGMLTDILAREHVQELLRKAEQERCDGGPRGDRRQVRPTLRSLLGRRRARGESSEENETPA
jgi:hypothetical protein